MKKEKFGVGQEVCKVCGQQLTDLKVLTVKIAHVSGHSLVDLRYFPPLCEAHRADGCLNIDIGWEASPGSIDEMKDP